MTLFHELTSRNHKNIRNNLQKNISKVGHGKFFLFFKLIQTHICIVFVDHD